MKIKVTDKRTGKTRFEEVKPMAETRIRNPICMDCGVDTDAINETFMIHDELWREANPAEAGTLCVGCCERRLGRKITPRRFSTLRHIGCR